MLALTWLARCGRLVDIVRMRTKTKEFFNFKNFNFSLNFKNFIFYFNFNINFKNFYINYDL
jgi:hypothetical protein